MTVAVGAAVAVDGRSETALPSGLHPRTLHRRRHLLAAILKILVRHHQAVDLLHIEQEPTPRLRANTERRAIIQRRGARKNRIQLSKLLPKNPA